MAGMTLDLSTLVRLHERMLGKPPNRSHVKLYEGFPTARGFSVRPDQWSGDDPRFEAALLLALAQTLPLSKARVFHRSYLVTTPLIEKQINGWLEQFIKRIFNGYLTAGDKKAARVMGDCLSNLSIAHHALQFLDEPSCWSTYGFRARDVLPDWMQGRLI